MTTDDAAPDELAGPVDGKWYPLTPEAARALAQGFALYSDGESWIIGNLIDEWLAEHAARVEAEREIRRVAPFLAMHGFPGYTYGAKPDGDSALPAPGRPSGPEGG